jgi:predicted O-methyltransferase YrrM
MNPPLGDAYRPGELSSELRAYLQRVSPPEHAELAALRERTAALPFVAMMQGSSFVGQLLQFLIRLIDARRVLEVGVFTGCSTLAMATALPPDGRIVGVEISEKWPAIGREFWIRSGCADQIDLRIGPATGVLDSLVAEGLTGAFDLAFIDADKDAYDAYFERCLLLLRQNGVMVFDNVLFGGLVPEGTEAEIRLEHRNQPAFLQDLYVRSAEGLRRFNDRIARDTRVDVAILPMSDGVTLARKRPPATLA